MIHEYEIVVFNGRRYLVTAVLSSTEAVGIPMEVFSDEKAADPLAPSPDREVQARGGVSPNRHGYMTV